MRIGLIFPKCNKSYPGNTIKTMDTIVLSQFPRVDNMNDEGMDNDIPEIVFPKNELNHTKESLVIW